MHAFSPSTPDTTTTLHTRRHHPTASTTSITTMTVATSTTIAPLGVSACSRSTVTCTTGKNFTVIATGGVVVELSVSGAGGSYGSSGQYSNPVTLSFAGPAGVYYFTATASNGSPAIQWSTAGASTCSAS